MAEHYDTLIVGGGLVGASLACALADAGLRIGVVEASPFGSRDQASFDDRAIALAAGSQRIFAAMGLWPAIAPAATPIERVHVSDRGRFGFARLDRHEAGVPALGQVVLSRDLGRVLAERLQQLDGVELITPAEVTAIDNAASPARVHLTRGGRPAAVTADLVVAADGARSQVRAALGIGVTERDYRQTAVITNIRTAQPHRNVAYERFTDQGPIALLPMSEGRCSVVWVLPTGQADAVMALDDAACLTRLQTRFGYRLGRFERIGRRNAYPLVLVRARESIRPRLALIGNAAHTLHPIAGQGFNLGLRDVAALAEVVCDAHRAGRDPGETAVLQQYADWRRADHRRVVAFTDGLTRLFTNPLTPVALLRDAGMLAMDLCPPAKRLFGRLAMGRSGRLPRLARGVGL
ncbi:MAG TPA: 2-octaprenyl-6-methoxyphenyl hydroxylase [Arenicellales bacterium]|nr:2-octaprenyl-6-methoxyphenyl hydroxylase [Arenicellales bacterium]